MCALWVNLRKVNIHEFVVAHDNYFRTLKTLRRRCSVGRMFVTNNVTSGKDVIWRVILA